LNNGPYAVEDEIIHELQFRFKDEFIYVQNDELKPGDEVIIEEGPLARFAGVFQETKARDRVLMLLSNIAYQAKIEVDKNYLSKLL
jgi:transcription antitermination factor NusG